MFVMGLNQQATEVTFSPAIPNHRILMCPAIMEKGLLGGEIARHCGSGGSSFAGDSNKCLSSAGKNMVYLKLPDEQMPDYNKLIMHIYDVTGRRIHSGPVGFDPLVKIDCSLWGSGIYFFRLMSNGTELANGKIAIQ